MPSISGWFPVKRIIKKDYNFLKTFANFIVNSFFTARCRQTVPILAARWTFAPKSLPFFNPRAWFARDSRVRDSHPFNHVNMIASFDPNPPPSLSLSESRDNGCFCFTIPLSHSATIVSAFHLDNRDFWALTSRAPGRRIAKINKPKKKDRPWKLLV
jgi:hypothetical protein